MTSRGAIVILATAGLVAVASLGTDADARRGERRDGYWKARAEMYEAAYVELSDGLDRIEKINDGRYTRRTQRRIDRAIERTRERALDRLRVDEPVVVEPAEPTAMDRDAFARLRESVSDASFARDRLRLVESAAEHNFFTVNQVIALMRLAEFETTKIEMAAALYPRVLELDDWYRVYDALTFESSKKKLRKQIDKLSSSDY